MSSVQERFGAATQEEPPHQPRATSHRPSSDEIRAELSAVDSPCLAFADALRQRFGAKLVWLRTERLEVGRDPLEAAGELAVRYRGP